MSFYQYYTIRESIIKNGETQTLINACKSNNLETIYYILKHTFTPFNISNADFHSIKNN